jgi:hypothetical protein
MSWEQNFLVRFLVRVMSPLLRALGFRMSPPALVRTRTGSIFSVRLSTGVLYVETPPLPLTVAQRHEVAYELRKTASYIADCARDRVLDAPSDLGWARNVRLCNGGSVAIDTPGADERPGGRRLPYMTRQQVIEVIDELRGLAVTIEEGRYVS